LSKSCPSRSNIIEKQQRLVVRVGDLDVMELILLRRLQLDTLNDLHIIGPVDLWVEQISEVEYDNWLGIK
jgi:hypothetical protein